MGYNLTRDFSLGDHLPDNIQFSSDMKLAHFVGIYFIENEFP